jgi:hypothetical protein
VPVLTLGCARDKVKLATLDDSLQGFLDPFALLQQSVYRS